MKHLRLVPLLLLTLWLSGCRGWDDDSEYAVETRASFFLVNGNPGLSLLELRDGNLEADINARLGISNAALSAVSMVDNQLWLASGEGNRLIVVDPETREIKEEFAGLPLAPHHFSVGREQIILTDTAAGKIAFIRLRNGKVTEVEFEGKPGLAIYSNGRFYTQVNDSLVDVFDEKALTPRAELNFGARINEFQLDRFKNIYVFSQLDSTRFGAIIASNADYISRTNFEVSYEKVRYTPYFARRYTSEYLTDLQLEGGVVQTPTLTPVVDAGIGNFEVNFFAGELFYFRNDSMFRYDLNRAVPMDSMAFGYEVLNSWYQLVNVE